MTITLQNSPNTDITIDITEGRERSSTAASSRLLPGAVQSHDRVLVSGYTHAVRTINKVHANICLTVRMQCVR